MTKALKITNKENKGLKRVYAVVVPAASIEEQVEAELQKVGAQAKVPGFRPGKIPTQILRQKYGQSVMGEVVEKSVNKAALEVTTEKKEKPAMQPKIEITKFEEGGDLEFSMEFELMPDSPKVDFSKIKLEREVVEIGEDQLKDALTRVAESNRKLEPKAAKSKAANGDVTKIDFKGFLGDEPFPGGEGAGFNLELGSNQFIPGFEEQIVGAKAGDDVVVTVSFPKDYHSTELAGKEARFEVHVQEVLEAKLPEINDEFAKTIGMESAEKLKEAITSQLEKDYGSIARSKVKKALFDALDDAAKFDVPESMVKMEFDSIWKQYEDGRASGEIQEDRSEDELKEEYQEIAARRVKLGIFLSQLAAKEKVEIDKQELTGAVLEQARMYPGQEQKIFEFYRENPEHLQELRGPILEEKAVDLILEKAKVTDKKVSVEELLKEEDEAPAKKKPAAKKKAAAKKPAEKATAEKKPAAKKPAAKKKA